MATNNSNQTPINQPIHTTKGHPVQTRQNKSVQTAIQYISFILVILLMISASEHFGSREIIFPEVAALALGSFITPSLKWNTNYLRMTLCILICAGLGLLIVLFCPGPLWLKFTLGYILGQIILYISGTSLAPMISAICLPILISTTNPIYVLAATILTLSIIVVRMLLVHFGINQPVTYTASRPDQKSFTSSVLLRTACVLILSILLFQMDFRFAVAPPLLVAFTELCSPDCPAAKHRLKVIALVFLCGLCGALSRYLFCIKLEQSLTLAALLTALCILFLVKIFQLPFPPAGAIGILSLLIPEDYVLIYPVHILLGISLLVFFSWGISSFLTRK